MTFVVAIDGPAGTGKSTVARALAHRFDFTYVDTGAFYRALAFLVEQSAIDPKDEASTASLVKKISIEVDDQQRRIHLATDGQVIDDQLRSESVSHLSSIISQHQEVRSALLMLQRELVFKIKHGAIYEGRDIGTVVFPKAPLKFFITADHKTRAQRRYQQLKKANLSINFDDIYNAIKERDQRDENRAIAPLQIASDAHVIDTSNLGLDEVTALAVDLITSARLKTKEGNDLW